MSEPTPPPIYKDRKTGLVIFGSFTVFFGLCFALMGGLILVGSAAAASHPNPSRPPINLAWMSLLYFGLAVVVVWLGIGSIKARRWARTLLVVWSWSLLVLGLISVTAAAFYLPHVAEAIAAQRPATRPAPESVRILVIVIPLALEGVFLICLPLIWGIFYSRKSVKATCEARDPVTRWTDRCPLPVLAASLWLVFGVTPLLMVPAFHSTALFFGTFLSGPAGTIYYIFVAVVWLYGAWALYRLELRGWWIVLVASVLSWLSTIISYSRHSLGDMYAKMGYSPAQIESLHFFTSLHSWPMVSMLALAVPSLGYLIWIRKFFRQPGALSA